MNNGAFGENFPYSNFHDLNMDWIINIVKTFNDQYTHIQEIITNGETSLTTIITEGETSLLDATTAHLAELTQKSEELEALLQDWYDTHSEDIQNELSSAIQEFTTRANRVVSELLETIPQDYSALSAEIVKLSNINKYLYTQIINTDIFEPKMNWVQGGWGDISNYSNPLPNEYEQRIRCQIDLDLEDTVDYLKLIPIDHELVYACFDRYHNLLQTNLAWSSDPKEIYHNDIKTIRLILRNADQSNLIPASGYSSIQLVTHETIDFKSLNSRLDTMENDIVVASDGSYKFNYSEGGYGAIDNYTDPSIAITNLRIRTEKVISCPGGLVITPSDGYDVIYAVFDSNNNTLAYTRSWTSTPIYIDKLDCKTIRLAVRKHDNSEITSNLDVITVKPIVNSHIKLKVCTFNIGHFSYGVSPYYLNTDFDNKLANYRKFFEELDCDIFGIQENNVDLDGYPSGSYPTSDYLYDYIAPFVVQVNNSNALRSRIRLYNTGVGNLPVNSKYYMYGTLRIDNKEIFVVCSHLTPNAGTSEEAARIAERDYLISLAKQHKYAIIMCDFNAQTTDFYNEFIRSVQVLH